MTLRALASSTLLFAAGALSADVPQGFQDQRVLDIPLPTALAQLPDGRLLVTSQDGRLWLVAMGASTATRSLALDLSSRICDDSEQGLLGVDVDPDFTVNGRTYLYYTFRNRGGCPGQDPESPVNRVSRFRLQGSAIDPASEVVLIDNIPSYNGNHNGGDLLVGKDGLLYVSVGDGGCDFRGDSGCAGDNDAARDRNTLLGKVLRITREGEIPADNPFLGANSVRCNQGNGASGTVCRETWAWGLRNPFRIAGDPNAQGTRIFVNDVGQGDWEEVDELTRGADYGWNEREGKCRNGSQSNCPPPPAGLTDPIHAYSHNSACGSITGGAFVPNGAWTSALDGGYLFADFNCNAIFNLRQTAPGVHSPQPFADHLDGGGPVAMKFLREVGEAAPRALFYTTYANGGQLRKIVRPGANGRPTAQLSVSPASGEAPLTVRLDASASSDPEGDPLTYRFSFGDGDPDEITGAHLVDHTYDGEGTFTAAVVVSDADGSSSPATRTIRVGQGAAPTIELLVPGADFRFSVGQTIGLRVRALDGEDGALPGSAITWTVARRHDQHEHPYVPETHGKTLNVRAPAPEDLPSTGNSWLVVRIRAIDSDGQETTLETRLLPKKVRLTLRTIPADLRVRVNGTPITAAGGRAEILSWAGWRLNLEAFAQTSGGTSYRFVSWSDGGAAKHTFTTPHGATTLTARYRAR